MQCSTSPIKPPSEFSLRLEYAFRPTSNCTLISVSFDYPPNTSMMILYWCTSYPLYCSFSSRLNGLYFIVFFLALLLSITDPGATHLHGHDFLAHMIHNARIIIVIIIIIIIIVIIIVIAIVIFRWYVTVWNSIFPIFLLEIYLIQDLVSMKLIVSIIHCSHHLSSHWLKVYS